MVPYHFLSFQFVAVALQFFTNSSARRLVWADTPGIDSLGDAQTIIQQNFLISFYCGRQFLSIANVELFVKTEDPFDWDKAKIRCVLSECFFWLSGPSNAKNHGITMSTMSTRSLPLNEPSIFINRVDWGDMFRHAHLILWESQTIPPPPPNMGFAISKPFHPFHPFHVCRRLPCPW